MKLKGNRSATIFNYLSADEVEGYFCDRSTNPALYHILSVLLVF